MVPHCLPELHTVAGTMKVKTHDFTCPKAEQRLRLLKSLQVTRDTLSQSLIKTRAS